MIALGQISLRYMGYCEDYFLYLKISSIFFRLSFPITKKKAPTPNNAVGIAKYSRSDIGSPHILSITLTTTYHISKKDTPPYRYGLQRKRPFLKSE